MGTLFAKPSSMLAGWKPTASDQGQRNRGLRAGDPRHAIWLPGREGCAADLLKELLDSVAGVEISFPTPKRPRSSEVDFLPSKFARTEPEQILVQAPLMA